MKALNALSYDQLSQIVGLVLSFLASTDSSELIGFITFSLFELAFPFLTSNQQMVHSGLLTSMV